MLPTIHSYHSLAYSTQSNGNVPCTPAAAADGQDYFNKTLEMEDLGRVYFNVDRYACRWADLAVQLKLDSGLVDLIKLDYEQEGVSRCLAAMLEHAIEQKKLTKPEELWRALQHIELIAFAGTFKEKISKAPPQFSPMSNDDAKLIRKLNANSMRGICSKWFPLGLALKLSVTKLNEIKKDNGLTMDRFAEMLRAWIEQRGDSTTVAEFVHALKTIELISMAGKIEEAACAIARSNNPHDATRTTRNPMTSEFQRVSLEDQTCISHYMKKGDKVSRAEVTELKKELTTEKEKHKVLEEKHKALEEKHKALAQKFAELQGMLMTFITQNQSTVT